MTVFVYGSLKRNKKLHAFLKNAGFLGKASICKKYPLVLSPSGWYPYMLDIPNTGFNVKGELYKINYNLLKKLDRLEEVPFYYKRKRICVKINNKSISAWAYFYAGNKKFLVKDLIEEF